MSKPDTRAYGYFDHDADVGVIGRGQDIERAFENAALATFALMADPATVRPQQALSVAFDEDDAELALATWLNHLLGEAQRRELVLCEFRLRRDGAHWHGQARGERWREGIERGVEVKGATLTALRVSSGPEGVEARCVVDV
ncbi:archease [Vulcaniibacterium gelatinicum]|uniref:archease n=1 Tax=Vulcaniibacterium gelatinicum TaxID=2598725 RepID=UPI0011C82C47|nr:archease [Vulcaniibacterium gelatinicum]